MKAYHKVVIRLFGANRLRLVCLALVIAIGIAIMTGINGVPPRLDDSIVVDPAQVPIVEAISEKLVVIGYIFPSFFVIIAGLTAFITITRLIEEERSQIACLKTLGFPNRAIVAKYLFFTFSCLVVGCSLGLVIGHYLFLPIIFNAVTKRFDLVASGKINIVPGLVWSLVMSLALMIITLVVCWRRCRQRPSLLLRGKAPGGRRIWLEYLPLIWRPLKFKYKASLRNIFRYKSRLLMTLLLVTGCTIILFGGFGLFNSLDGSDFYTPELADSIIPIAVAVIIFAIALVVLVIFNLTNINIEERRREIASLRVLGYGQREVAGYIYREVFILSVVGILDGLPLGYLVLGVIFDLMGFGRLADVQWYTWVATVAIAFLSVVIAEVLLYHKIKEIDMTSSLKAVE